jgi:hypothetical protein
MRFRPDIYEQLLKSGWFPGRRVPVEVPHDAAGLFDNIPPLIASIVAEFAGLKIDVVPKQKRAPAKDYSGPVRIRLSNYWVDIESMEALSGVLGGMWFSIGVVEDEDIVLGNEEGTIVLASAEFEYYASSFEVFLQKVLTGEARESCPADFLPGKWPRP